MAESLSDSRLEVRIARADTADAELDPRQVEVLGIGTRWAN
jgi:tRNA threonylcarbamoyladenosine biosynthesis protein TsaE